MHGIFLEHRRVRESRVDETVQNRLHALNLSPAVDAVRAWISHCIGDLVDIELDRSDRGMQIRVLPIAVLDAVDVSLFEE